MTIGFDDFHSHGGCPCPRRKNSQHQNAQVRFAGSSTRTFQPIDFFETLDLDDIFAVEEAVENFIFEMEDGQFLAWEAVVCHEQGLPLTRQQKAALSELINFGDPDDDQILYINEIPRTTEPWYEILRKIAPRLLVEPFRTFDEHTEAQCDGWRNLVDCLSKHAAACRCHKA